MLLLAETPLPVTVTNMVAEVAAAVADAVRVRVCPFVLTLAGAVCGLADHFAVTPPGSPLTE